MISRFSRQPRLIAIGLAILAIPLMVLGGYAVAMFNMPGSSRRGPLPPLTTAQKGLAERLRAHVVRLADTIGERHIWRRQALDETVDYIRSIFAQHAALVVEEPFACDGKTVCNLYIEFPGNAPKAEWIVVGAHYDSVVGVPAANDNGSGVAALLELAGLLHGRSCARGLRLVAFVNEEAPFFLSGEMGSMVHASEARERGERIAGMFSLETIGYFSDERGSQHYPPVVGLAYPDTGNFIGFVGNRDSGELVRRAIGSFRRHAAFPSEGIAAPEFVHGINLSDHASFWRYGYQAVMITDTAPYRYPWYHDPGDTPDKLDYERMARVVEGLASMLEDLANAN